MFASSVDRARLFYAIPLISAGLADRQISLHSALSPGSAAAFLCRGTLFNWLPSVTCS